MRCDTAREHFSDYASGTAHEALRAALDLHLADCPSCRREVEDLKVLWRALDHLEVVEAPAGLRAEVWRRIEHDLQTHAMPTRRPLAALLSARWRRIAVWAAAACFVVVLAGVTVPGHYQRALLGDLGFHRFLPISSLGSMQAQVSSVRPVVVGDRLFDEVHIAVQVEGPGHRVRILPEEGQVVTGEEVLIGSGAPSEVVVRVGHTFRPHTLSLRVQDQADPRQETVLRLTIPASP